MPVRPIRRQIRYIRKLSQKGVLKNFSLKSLSLSKNIDMIARDQLLFPFTMTPDHTGSLRLKKQEQNFHTISTNSASAYSSAFGGGAALLRR